jgi:hypothetical protein
MNRKGAVLSWAVVTLVGVIVVVLVLALQLFPRLTAAQNLIDAAEPAFSQDRVAGDRAAINMVATAVNAVDPVATDQGGAAAEVPQLVAFVAQQTGLTEAQVLEALQTNFPHTTALLQAIPLSSVTAELPGLVNFLATTLNMTPDQVMEALKTNFPHLAQAVVALPDVTNGWNDVPDTENLTRFDGDPVNTVPDIRDYFSQDVIPALERQQGNFQDLASNGGVGYLAPLLLIVGLVVIVFGVLMMFLASRGLSRGIAAVAWSVVTVVGVVVVVLVLTLGLFPRLNGGQELLDDLRPAFTAERVAGDRAAINMLSSVVDVADPIGTPEGGAAAEVPQLVAFVAQQTGLTEAQVLEALQTNFPHTTALLQAIPLSSVSAEIPNLVNFLATTLKMTPDQVMEALETNFPNLAEAVTALPTVTSNWYNVPGTEQLTTFSGAPVRSVPAIRSYFSQDVIPVLETQQANYQKVDTTPPRLPVFPPLLLVIGILVIIYGIVMLVLSQRSPR